MSEDRKKYKVEIVDSEEVLNEVISINNNQVLFAVYLDNKGVISDLEYQTINSIKTMIEDSDYSFLKVTKF